MSTSDITPTVVLVHGAFVDASSWNGVIAELKAAGLDVVALRGWPYDIYSYAGAAPALAAAGYRVIVPYLRLAAFPAISGPTITLEGDANGAPHPEPAAYAARFTGKYVHRTLTGGIGHNRPQEAPADFARAVEEADGFA